MSEMIQQSLESALAHHQAGRLQEAEIIYRQILSIQPENPDALHLLGAIALRIGQYEPAIQLFNRAIKANPTAPHYYSNLGRALSLSGRPAEAIGAFQQALALNPDLAEIHVNLGALLQARGDLEGAIAAYKQAAIVKPNYAEAFNCLGNAYQVGKEFPAAMEAYRKALAIRPDFHDARSNLGCALRISGETDAAVAELRKAFDARPDSERFGIHLAEALQHAGETDAANAVFRQVLSLSPVEPETNSNLGEWLKNQGEFEQAVAACRKAISARPNFGQAHFNLALIMLLQGNLTEGLREYEWRWQVPRSQQIFSQPLWDGSNLTGKRLLVYTEQGFGDAIQFARYLSLIEQRGGSVGNVFFQCQPELASLLSSVKGVHTTVVAGQAIPEFDVHRSLLSLPFVFDTNLRTIPSNVPYLHADAERVQQWQARLKDQSRLKVGLVWSGGSLFPGNPNRSPGLNEFAALAGIEGVQFYSLQKGPAAQQANSAPAGLNMIDWTDELHDFADTAALIESLDLVVSCDTALAHLAGALGKPVWILLQHVPDWRWLLDRSDSPWYPTMKLFRQHTMGDWKGPIEGVVEMLREFSTRAGS